MNNQYGLDANYFREALSLIARDVENYTPAEMSLALERLGRVACHQHHVVVAQEAKKREEE